MALEQGDNLFVVLIRGRDTVGGRISVVDANCNGKSITVNVEYTNS